MAHPTLASSSSSSSSSSSPPPPSYQLSKVQRCALNNALYLAAFLASHNRRSHLDPDVAWHCPLDLPVPFTPNLVTLHGPDLKPQHHRLAQQLIEDGGLGEVVRRWGVKDSFATMELGLWGFEVVVDGAWLWAGGGGGGGGSVSGGGQEVMGDTTEVVEVLDNLVLEDFEAHWKENERLGSVEGSTRRRKHFVKGLLEVEQLKVLVAKVRGESVAGCVANLGAGVVGVTNVWITSQEHGERVRLRRVLFQTVQNAFEDNVPLVAWDHGSDLEEMLEVGFREVGKMRVWERSA